MPIDLCPESREDESKHHAECQPKGQVMNAVPSMQDVANKLDDTDERFALSRRSLIMGGAAAGAALILGWPTTAEAASFKTVRSTPVRNGPSVGSTIVKTIASGTTVNVGSQTAGTKCLVGTYPNNCTWNRLTDGTWIHDRDLNTSAGLATTTVSGSGSGYFKGTSGLPRCTASTLGRTQADAAAWWAETHLGVDMYKGWCLAFCMNAWRWGAGRTNVLSADTAILNWNRISAANKSTSTNPPRGALVYWSTNAAEGHVAIAAGGGYVVTTWVGGTSSKIAWKSISSLSATSGWKYKGWAWPYY